MKTLNKHTKWRKDNQAIFICDCKRLIDLKLDFKYEEFMKNLIKGVNEEELSPEEKLVLRDFEKMKLLSELKIEQISGRYFKDAMKVLDNELGKERVRDSKFLQEKFNEFPIFFIGAFLNKELIGVICGFPREDYLLISEIAIDSRFNGRGLGKRLILAFEKANNKYNKINVGARDPIIGFYSSMEYNPFLLAQGNLSKKDLSEFEIIKRGKGFAEIVVDNISIETLMKLRKKYPKLNFQYIFQKIIKKF